MIPPQVSVIVATHNRATLLERSLGSILKQTYRAFEIIVVDDCSDDQTPAVLQDYQERYPFIRAIRLEHNVGPGAARNIGMREAQGKYIAILDDDDVSLPARLERQVELMEANAQVGLCFGLVQWMDKEWRPTGVFPGLLARNAFPQEPAEVFSLLLLNSNKVSNTTIMLRRDLLAHYAYAEDVHVGEDWYMFLSMAASGIRMQGIPEILVQMDRSEQPRLMRRGVRVFSDQRKVLRRISAEYKLPLLLRLHVFSNQYIREAAALGRWQAAYRVLRALVLWPGNREAYDFLFRKASAVLSRRSGHRRREKEA